MILVIGTCDTKRDELRYVRDLIAARGLATQLVDVSTSGAESDGDITPDAVAAFHPDGRGAVFASGDRGIAITAMAVALERYVAAQSGVLGAIALGGSGGTALAAPALRALPIGVPKMLVSTVASGNVAPYIGASDISLVYSITDICGLNRISRVVLANAAHALAGMVELRQPIDAAARETLGLTMFGVTTPCVQQLTAALSDRYDCLVFHATGTGGQSFEKLVDSGLINAGLDVTTTEVCDLLLGGVFPATEDRFGAFIRTQSPYVGSCGALDMVNFGAMDTVPEPFRGRKLHVHNPQVTLMRTSPAECAAIGEWIGQRLNAMHGQVRFLIPEGGVSALSVPGQPFHDPDADQALFDALIRTVQVTASRRIERSPHPINSPEFVAALLAAFEDATDAARQKEIA